MAIGQYDFLVPPESNGQTLKTFLRKACGISARSMTVLKSEGAGITRNGTELRAHDMIAAGEIITVCLPTDKNDAAPTAGMPDILFEDDRLLIVNKPAGMPVHPTKKHQLDTLANATAYYQQGRGEDYTFRALNRLDKDTSGCVIIAKDRIAYSLVKDAVQKTYIAVCEGLIDQAGTIDAPIALEAGSKMKRCVSEYGSAAVTHYRPIMRGREHTMCELWLDTGRTHQIRCHMRYIGHPLAGDDLYGGSLRLIQRQALHCRFVTLVHPVTQETMRFDAGMPAEFDRIIKEG